MATCPNKNLKAWKDLSSQYGDTGAMFMYTIEGDIPTLSRAEEIALEYDLVGDNFLTSPNARVKPGVEELFERSKETLTDKLNSFLQKLNFEVKTVDDIKELTGYDAQAATDLIYKTILISNTKNSENLLSKEVAYVAYSLLGKKNKIRTDLIYSIENLDNYETIYKNYKDNSPQLNDYKIKELIVVDYLADAIKNNYNLPKDSYQNREASYWQIKGNSVLEKKIKYQLGRLRRFISKLLNLGKLPTNELTKLYDDIANDILNNVFNKFGSNLSASDQLTNYEDTIKNDKRASDIINSFQDLGLLLTGSLALRKQGTLYRSKKEDLHDLDFTVPESLFSEKYKEIQIERQNEIDKLSNKYKRTDPGFNLLIDAIDKKYNQLSSDIVENSRWFKNIKTKYPTLKKVRSFGGSSGQTFTWTGKIDEKYMIDLFVTPDDRLGVTGKRFQNWESIFKAKLQMGRVKDIKDFANYIPFSTNTIKFSQNTGFRHFNFNSINLKQPSSEEFVADSSNEILLQTKKTEYKKDNATVKSKDVNDKLSEFAGKYGFSIQGLEDYKTSYKHRTGQDLNVDATGLIDMFSKLIAIDPNTSDYSTLPEEIGHLADALLGDNPLAVNARNLAGESSVFEEIKDEYTEIYSKMFPHLNEAKIRELVKREALGKLIGKELIRDNSLTGKMKRVFEKLINLFLSKVSKAAELKKYVTEIADAVLDNNSNIFDQANINTREMFFQTKKSKFDRIVTTLENKLKILERKAYASDTKFEQAEKLKKEIEEIKASIANNLEIDAVDKFLDFALEETSTVLEAIEKGRQFSYAEIQDLDTFIRFYDPLLKEDVRPYVKRRNITELRTKVDKLSLDIEDLNTFYRDNRVESFKSVLGPLVDKIKNSKYAVNLDTYLNSVIDDITSTQAFMGISRLTKDQTVRQVAKIVTDSKNKVHFNTIEYAKRLGEVLEGLTREQLDLFYETTDGKASGYIAREQNYQKAFDSLDSFKDKINARYNISSESEQRAQQIEDMPENVKKQYFKEIREWWVKNSTVTKTSAEIESIYNQKKLTMSKKDFTDWVSTNIREDSYGNKQASLSFNEFRVPKNSLYKNPAYEQIQKDPKLKKAYDTLLKIKGELDSKIPKKTNLYKLPQVSKTTLDRLINGRGFKEIPELLEQEFVSRVDDVEFGDQESIFDKDGVELKFIPIHYLKTLENTDNISRNIGGIFLNYAEMAENFVEMSSIAPQLELILDEVGDLKFKSGFKGKTKEGLESNVYKMLKGFMDEHLYGKEKEAITQEVFGVEVNITKVMNNVNRWVRNTNLINNWFTMATNLITSESWRKIEDIIGQHTTQESSFFALKEFINYLPSSVVDKYKVMKTNKLSLILERFKVMDDVKGQFANMDKSQAVKAAVSLPYLGYEMGDFKVKAHMTISMLDNIRFIDGEWQNRQTYLSKATTPEQKKQLQETWSNNRDKSLWNAYSVEGSKLKHSVPQELELEVITKIRTVGSRLDGMISETDRAAIHRHVYAQLFATHRNWLFQGVQDRFNPYVWDYSIGEMTGGRYRTAYNLASNLFKEAIEKKNIPDLIANWNNLEDFEKRNIYGVLLDQVYVATAFVFYLMMNALADDDKEDSYFIESMAYLSSRLLLEQSALVPVSILTGNIPMVSEMMAVMESPIPAARQLELLTDIYGWFDGTEVERGAYKGMSKRTKKLLKLIPGVKGAIESTDPKSKNQWLKNKALKSYWMQDYVTD